MILQLTQRCFIRRILPTENKAE